MNIAKLLPGQQGIRRIVKLNGVGWHVYYDGAYDSYKNESLEQLRTINHGWTVEIVGNILFFTK